MRVVTIARKNIVFRDLTNISRIPAEARPKLLAKSLESMSQKQRSYFEAYYMGGLTIYEIAEEYGVNPSTVFRVIKSGIRRLNKIFENTIIIVKEV